MSPVRLVILLVAAVAAIGAVFLVRSVQQPQEATAAAIAPVAAPEPVKIPTKQILVAKETIPVGRFVSLDDLAWQEWPAEAPVESFIDQEDEPEALEKMVGAVARVDLVKGEPVTKAKLVHPGQAGFMSVMLTPGMRAVSI
jgi:pilus assembly protein CpaB